MGILKYRTEAEGWDFYFMMERIEFLIWRQKVMRFPLGDKEFLVSLDVMFEILGFSTRASRILVLQEILGIWTCLSKFRSFDPIFWGVWPGDMDEFCVSLTGIAKCNERIKLSIDKIKSLCTFRASLTPRLSLRNRYIRQGKMFSSHFWCTWHYQGYIWIYHASSCQSQF